MAFWLDVVYSFQPKGVRRRVTLANRQWVRSCETVIGVWVPISSAFNTRGKLGDARRKA